MPFKILRESLNGDLISCGLFFNGDLSPRFKKLPLTFTGDFSKIGRLFNGEIAELVISDGKFAMSSWESGIQTESIWVPGIRNGILQLQVFNESNRHVDIERESFLPKLLFQNCTALVRSFFLSDAKLEIKTFSNAFKVPL